MNSQKILVYPLGAGQDVGRSCILIEMLDRRILLDCGLHMGYSDAKKFPDFGRLKKKFGQDSMDDILDIVVVSHFHLDHIGALPFLTEITGYDGPIFTTTPTKALLPYMLEDYSRVVIENAKRDKGGYEDGEKKQYISYTGKQIKDCCDKVTSLNLHEVVYCKGVKIKTYYAGHILGACMFLIEYNGLKVVYTGDFNSSADRHLGAAWIEKVRPNVIITESTYATTVRDSKKSRERNFLKEIQETTENGGKVLVPVFALGRAQELCVLVETIWSRTGSKVPVYFSAGLIERVQFFYKLFVNWTNQKIKSSFVMNNMFDFKHIKPFDKNLMKSPQPMILFATPGMLHGGTSLQVFTEWCGDEKNTIIIPGYCVAGTLGNKLLRGMKKQVVTIQPSVNIDKRAYEVNMTVKNMSFSAHADSKGILGLIKHAEPDNVVLVHGEKGKMEVICEVIKETLKIPCFFPANFESLYIDVKAEEKSFPIGIDQKLLSIDFSQGLKLPLLLLREGGSSTSLKTNIAKDFVVSVTDRPNEFDLTQEEDAANQNGGTEAEEGMQLEPLPVQQLRLLPHKILRFKLNDYYNQNKQLEED